MYKFANGHTKESVLKALYAGNNGNCATATSDFDGSPTCVYKTYGGNKCAIGCFIPEGHRGQSHSGSVTSLLAQYSDLVQYMPFAEAAPLLEFQKAHDSYRHFILNGEHKPDVREALKAWLEQNVEGCK